MSTLRVAIIDSSDLRKVKTTMRVSDGTRRQVERSALKARGNESTQAYAKLLRSNLAARGVHASSVADPRADSSGVIISYGAQGISEVPIALTIDLAYFDDVSVDSFAQAIAEAHEAQDAAAAA